MEKIQKKIQIFLHCYFHALPLFNHFCFVFVFVFFFFVVVVCFVLFCFVLFWFFLYFKYSATFLIIFVLFLFQINTYILKTWSCTFLVSFKIVQLTSIRKRRIKKFLTFCPLHSTQLIFWKIGQRLEVARVNWSNKSM